MSLSLDEVTDESGDQRLVCHAYGVDDRWCRVPIFLGIDEVHGSMFVLTGLVVVCGQFQLVKLANMLWYLAASCQ